MIYVMVHDDDCGQFLAHTGNCPKHGFVPDMQSMALIETDVGMLEQRIRCGETFMGMKRIPLTNCEDLSLNVPMCRPSSTAL